MFENIWNWYIETIQNSMMYWANHLGCYMVITMVGTAGIVVVMLDLMGILKIRWPNKLIFGKKKEIHE